MTGIATSLASLAARRWDADRALAWHDQRPWLVGTNFTPSTASNQLEMWQAATFDPATIDRELGWAAALGMNAMRVFLHDLCWQDDRTGFCERIERYLAIAERHGIATLFVFFDSCWAPDPRLGPQEAPIPGRHNSRWVQSPGVAVLRYATRFSALRGYVQDVLQRFRDDPRILGWDLWNEPDNGYGTEAPFPAQNGELKPAIMPLLAQVFAWAREVAPSQPLTSGIWAGDYAAEKRSAFQRLQIEASDIVSFHRYEGAEGTARAIAALADCGRPLWCTEYMARSAGSTFAAILPLFAERRIAAFNWGLVDGRTNTKFPWDSVGKPYDREPDPWFHEVLRRDGRPYREDEAALIRRLTATTNAATRRASSR